MNWAVIFWIALMAGFLLTEAATVQLVSLWFAGGAFAGMLVSLFHGPIWLQALVFLVVSGLLLGLLRPFVRKYMTPRITRTNVNSVPGSVGLVTAAIDNVTATGQVKLGGMEWTARSTGGQEIPVGVKVRVDRVEGVKVYVSPVE